MPNDLDSETHSRLTDSASDPIDRILLGVCVGVWLAALGAGVAAVVTLTDLGSKHANVSHATPWLLYTVIGVSAAVIIGAVPLLLRARRSANRTSPQIFAKDSEPAADSPPPLVGRSVEPGFGEAATTKLRSFNDPAVRGYSVSPASSMVGFPAAATDQLWLRSILGISTAMGLATLLVFLATYMMADAHDALSWTLYGVAGLFTVAMPAVAWYCLRELRAVLASAAESSRAA